MFTASKSVKVVVLAKPELNEEQLNSIFAVSAEAGWYRAIMQILAGYKQERLESAIGFMNENNATGMAGCNGGANIIDTIILDLEGRREDANK